MREGLHFTCSSMTVEHFKDKTNNEIVLVAWNEDSKVLLGIATITLTTNPKGVKYDYLEYVAISPSAKRRGIGYELLEEIINIVTNDGENVF